jgi:hypothetical protein
MNIVSKKGEDMKKMVICWMIVFASIYIYSEEIPSIACEFSELIVVMHSHPENPYKMKINQTMEITLGNTTDKTLGLDGSLRATNSKKWTKVKAGSYLFTWQWTFIGDDGDLLTIEKEFENYEELTNEDLQKGWYKAILVSCMNDSTSIRIGRCFIQ